VEVFFSLKTSAKSGAKNEGTLKKARAGQSFTVIKITGSGNLRKRLMEMGITKGTEIYVKKIAPLGDPMEITVRGYQLSLRKSEADSIVVI
jgi:ferrous iron transport protein A